MNPATASPPASPGAGQQPQARSGTGTTAGTLADFLASPTPISGPLGLVGWFHTPQGRLNAGLHAGLTTANWRALCRGRTADGTTVELLRPVALEDVPDAIRRQADTRPGEEFFAAGSAGG